MQPPRRTIARDFLCLAGLWLAALIFFWPILFGGQSLWFRDTLGDYYPEAQLTARAWRTAELPLWEPAIGLGYPYLADPHSMVFYPLSAVLLLAEFPLAYNLFVALHFPLMATFMYLLLRRWKVGPWPAAVGGAVLMLAGFTVSTASLTTLLRGLTWMPLAWLAFDWFLETGGRRGLAATALVLAVQGSGTDPQYVLLTALQLALLPAFSPSPRGIRPAAAMAGWLLACTLAVALLAYQYLPLAELARESGRLSGVAGSELTWFDVDPANLYNLFLPRPYPDPASFFYHASFHNFRAPFYPDLHLGVPLLLLLLASLGWLAKAEEAPERSPAAGRGRVVLIASGVALAALVLATGRHTPVFEWAASWVPGMGLFRYPAKNLLLAAVPTALLAALGAAGVAEGPRRCSVLLRHGAALATAGLAALLAAADLRGVEITTAFMGAPVSRQLPEVAERLRGAVTVALWLAFVLAGLCWALARSGRAVSSWVPTSSPGDGCLRSWAGVALGLLACLELGVVTSRGLPFAPAEKVGAEPKLAAVMASHGAGMRPIRFLCKRPRKVLMSEERTLASYAARDAELLEQLRGAPLGLGSVLTGLSLPMPAGRWLEGLFLGSGGEQTDRLARALGARYVTEAGGEGGGGAVLGTSSGARLRALSGALPRAFVAARAEPAASGMTLPTSGALLALPESAVFEGVPGVVGPLVPIRVKNVSIITAEARELAVSFGLEGRGLLVVLDAWYPGWRAEVDGRERPLVKVAGLFRGVAVVEGERHLRLSYEPRSFSVGCWASLLASAVWALLWFPPATGRGGNTAVMT